MQELLQEISKLKGSNRTSAIEQWMKSLASALESSQKSSDVDELVRFGESRSSAIQFLQHLADLGAGRFISGRKGKKTRIEWAPCSATEIARAYLNQYSSDAQIKRGPASYQKSSNEEAPLLEHRFQLRPNLVIPISLPTDLSTHEAQRLSDYIRTLPFSA